MGRRKRIEDDELLKIAQEVFVEQGIGASTREIARRAGISEAVIYQRFPTKEELFFSAMAPPAVDFDDLLTAGDGNHDVRERLHDIALAMVNYFRELTPILLPLATHPSFDYEEFVERHPDAPLSRIREGLMEYLDSQARLGRVNSEVSGIAGLNLVATLHSLAFFERLGVHGGRFDDDTVRALVDTLWAGLRPSA